MNRTYPWGVKGRHGSSTVTRGIRVEVQPRFLEGESSPQDRRYVFAYSVTIVNESDATVQIVARVWNIVDAAGACHDVEGDGVVGRQPVLEPGQVFEYESYCPLKTAWGTMEGRYRVQVLSGDADETFDARIGRFYLASPAEPATERVR